MSEPPLFTEGPFKRPDSQLAPRRLCPRRPVLRDHACRKAALTKAPSLRAARAPNASLRGRETEPGAAPGGAATPHTPHSPPPAPRGLQPPPAFQIPTAARPGRSDRQQRGKGARPFKSGAEPPPPPQHGGPGLPAAGRGEGETRGREGGARPARSAPRQNGRPPSRRGARRDL